jgi:protein TonB
MRYLFVGLAFFTINAQSQTTTNGTIKVKKTPGTGPVYSVAEQMPAFPGGDRSMMDFIRGNLVYPPKAIENGIEGTVYISFVVEKNGSLDSLKVIKGVPGGPELDSAALRVVGLMPGFIPGRNMGVPVRVQYNLPLRFRLK